MIENRTKNNCNEVSSFRIITCPICGFTLRLSDLKKRRKKRNCPMCGGLLFGLDLNKIIFFNRDKSFQNVR
ncbi:MAG: hypothetical protein ACFE94_18370 [Candidatus Hodarchaeota archaeon]